MLRRSLGFLLAAVMLCAAAGVGASAATLENEARVLVEGTLAVLESGTYTLKSKISPDYPYRNAYYVDQNRCALEEGAVLGWFSRLVLGQRRRTIYLPGETFTCYPDRQIYVKEKQKWEPNFSTPLDDAVAYIDIDSLTARLVTREGKEYIAAQMSLVFPGTDIPDDLHITKTFFYLDGQLNMVEITFNDLTDMFVFEELEQTVDESVFKPSGIRLPAFILFIVLLFDFAVLFW